METDQTCQNTDSKNPLKKLYFWTISLAEKPWALWALFFVAFAESSFFLIPPDVLLIPLVLGAATMKGLSRSKKLALLWRIPLICTLGSVLGGCFGYYVGHELMWGTDGSFSAFGQWFFEHDYIHHITEERFMGMRKKYEEFAFVIIFGAGFSPIPYKLVTITSGAFDINFLMFILASGVSRAGRFFLVAELLRRYGSWMQEIIDRHFNWVALAFTVLLAGGFYVLKVLL